MKFEEQLRRSRVSKWARYYVDYAGLKKILTARKNATRSLKSKAAFRSLQTATELDAGEEGRAESGAEELFVSGREAAEDCHETTRTREGGENEGYSFSQDISAKPVVSSGQRSSPLLPAVENNNNWLQKQGLREQPGFLSSIGSLRRMQDEWMHSQMIPGNIIEGWIPEWRIASLSQNRDYQQPESSLLPVAEFHHYWVRSLRREFEKVQSFFLAQMDSLIAAVCVLEQEWPEEEKHKTSSPASSSRRSCTTTSSPGSTTGKAEEMISSSRVRCKNLKRRAADLASQTVMLKDFSSLNYLAFYKITKKYDKMFISSGEEEDIKENTPERTKPLVTTLLPRLRKEAFYVGCRTLEMLYGDLVGLFERGEISGTREISGTMSPYPRGRARRALFFFLGCASTGSIGILGLLLLPSLENDDVKEQEKYLSQVMPIWRWCLMLNFLCWACGLCTKVFEKKNINFIFLLNMSPQSDVTSQFWCTAAAAQLMIWVLLFASFLADMKFTKDCYCVAAVHKDKTNALLANNKNYISFPTRRLTQGGSSSTMTLKDSSVLVSLKPPFHDDLFHDDLFGLVQEERERAICPTNTIYYQRCDVYPLLVLLVFTIWPFLPSRRLLGSHRKDFLYCMGQTLGSGFFKVTFASNLLGDVLTSITRPLKDLEYSLCYVLHVGSRRQWLAAATSTSSGSGNNNICSDISNKLISPGRFLLILPFWLRLLQCLRRALVDAITERKTHFVNAGKYVACLLVGLIAVQNLEEVFALSSFQANLVWAFLAIIATAYAYMWDITRDWGLCIFSARSKKEIFVRTTSDLPQNRDEHGNSLLPMLYPVNVYRMAAITNLLARLSWAYNLTMFLPFENPITDFLVAGIEILRRCQWTCLRVEYEHITNASKFRALCYVPVRMPPTMVYSMDGQGFSEPRGAISPIVYIILIDVFWRRSPVVLAAPCIF